MLHTQEYIITNLQWQNTIFFHFGKFKQTIYFFPLSVNRSYFNVLYIIMVYRDATENGQTPIGFVNVQCNGTELGDKEI